LSALASCCIGSLVGLNSFSLEFNINKTLYFRRTRVIPTFGLFVAIALHVLLLSTFLPWLFGIRLMAQV